MKRVFALLMTGIIFTLLPLALLAGTTQAAVITRNVIIDLEADGRIFEFADLDAWEGIVSIEDTSFDTGDTIFFNIRFANSKSLELSNPGTNPLNNGLELTKLTVFLKTHNGADYRASGFLHTLVLMVIY